jgi:hypothetical protein
MLEPVGISRDSEEVTKNYSIFGPEIRADYSQNKWQLLVRSPNPAEDRVYMYVCECK